MADSNNKSPLEALQKFFETYQIKDGSVEMKDILEGGNLLHHLLAEAKMMFAALHLEGKTNEAANGLIAFALSAYKYGFEEGSKAERLKTSLPNVD